MPFLHSFLCPGPNARAADVEMTVSGESNDVLTLKKVKTLTTHLTYSTYSEDFRRDGYFFLHFGHFLISVSLLLCFSAFPCFSAFIVLCFFASSLLSFSTMLPLCFSTFLLLCFSRLSAFPYFSAFPASQLSAFPGF